MSAVGADSDASIAVLSDIHGNARALEAALDQLGAKIDRFVILGDLLTYGPDVALVLDLVDGLLNDGAALILGNHDQMYLDLANGNRDYYSRLPSWLQESVDFTAKQLDVDRFRSLPWVPELTIGDIYFSHANPFGPGDWTYLNHEPEKSRARAVLQKRDSSMGVFGHSHRAFIDPPSAQTRLANPGSVGQPRSPDRRSTLLVLTVNDENVNGCIEVIAYDVAAHMDAIMDSSLSNSTSLKLCGYFQ